MCTYLDFYYAIEKKKLIHQLGGDLASKQATIPLRLSVRTGKCTIACVSTSVVPCNMKPLSIERAIEIATARGIVCIAQTLERTNKQLQQRRHLTTLTTEVSK